MPTLHVHPDRPGLLVTTTDPDGATLSYALEAEGERFLTLVLGVKPGDSIRAADLNLLLEREWARRLEPDDVAAQPRSTESIAEPVSQAPQAAASAPSVPAPQPARIVANRRSRAREVALQVLYQVEQNPTLDAAEVSRFVRRRLREEKLVGFATELVDGVGEHRKHIDGLITDVAENWRLDRMAAIDRNILRLGAFELLYRPDVPPRVAINEALELAKRYSTAQSSRFVNGILDRLQNARPEESDPLSATGEGDQAEGSETEASSSTTPDGPDE